MTIVEDLKKVKDQVEHILKTFPYTRNSDKDLFAKLCEEFYGVGSRISWAEFFDLPNYESIRRSRQLLQAKKLYPPTDPKIALARGWLEEEWKKALGYSVGEKGQMVML